MNQVAGLSFGVGVGGSAEPLQIVSCWRAAEDQVRIAVTSESGNCTRGPLLSGESRCEAGSWHGGGEAVGVGGTLAGGDQ